MSLRICKLGKHKDITREYLLLEATEDVNLSDYAVMARVTGTEEPGANPFRHFFRFPNMPVKKGELISLRTEKGINETGRLTTGGPVHRIYWGLSTPIWQNSDTASVEIVRLVPVEKQSTGNRVVKK